MADACGGGRYVHPGSNPVRDFGAIRSAVPGVLAKVSVECGASYPSPSFNWDLERLVAVGANDTLGGKYCGGACLAALL